MRSVSTRYTNRRGRLPHHLSRRSASPLTTVEQADRVLRIVTARLKDGHPLNETNWQCYCKNRAVYQVVAQWSTQQQLEEIAS